jgi:hypothetical protein
MAVHPLRHFLVRFYLGVFGFDISPNYPFPTEEHVVERTIEVIPIDCPGEQGSAFVECPAENDITANNDVWAAGRFLGEIFCVHSLLHGKP